VPDEREPRHEAREHERGARPRRAVVAEAHGKDEREEPDIDGHRHERREHRPQRAERASRVALGDLAARELKHELAMPQRDRAEDRNGW
jgi:hypothetical protein